MQLKIIAEGMGTIIIAFEVHTWAIIHTAVRGSLAEDILASREPFGASQPSKASFKVPFRASSMAPRPSLDNPLATIIRTTANFNFEKLLV